jgi:hypothetical protein
VIRSLILKALTHLPTGDIVAAPLLLPELIGGDATGTTLLLVERRTYTLCFLCRTI